MYRRAIQYVLIKNGLGNTILTAKILAVLITQLSVTDCRVMINMHCMSYLMYENHKLLSIHSSQSHKAL